MKKFFKTLYTGIAFTGLWLVPFLLLMIKNILPSMNQKTSLLCCLAVMAWTTFNNVWTVSCEGKRVSEIRLGDGLIPDNGLKKESPYKRMASYPKVPGMFLSKQPEGIILGAYKNRYVRVPAKEILHSCIIGGSGSGKGNSAQLYYRRFWFRQNLHCYFRYPASQLCIREIRKAGLSGLCH